MFHKKKLSCDKTNPQHTKTISKFTVKKPKILKESVTTTNLQHCVVNSPRKGMLDTKVDQLTSVDINMADVVEDVVMDSEETEEIIPKSTEE